MCSTSFPSGGRRTFCSDTCRKSAYRRRHQLAPEPVEVPARRPRRAITVYECPQCESRYLGEQHCDDCGVFCRRIGFGGTALTATRRSRWRTSWAPSPPVLDPAG